MKSCMKNSTLLKTTTKEEDGVICKICGKGIMIPYIKDAEKNFHFDCSYCGAGVNIDNNEIKID